MNHQAKSSNHAAFRAKTIALFSLMAFGFALAGCSEAAPVPEEPPLAGADIGGEFELINSSGETVRWSDFEGQYRIVYFGFTFCPDICPTDVSRMTRGLKIAQEADPSLADKVQAIFISVDPARDTPEKVGEFASAFSDDLMGLTGSQSQVDRAVEAFRVSAKREEGSSDDNYMMAHSTITYLFGPDGKPLATLPTDQGPDAVADEIKKWVS